MEVKLLLEKGDEMFGGFGNVVSALDYALCELRVTDAAGTIRVDSMALGLKPYSTRSQLLQATFDLFAVGSPTAAAVDDGCHRLDGIDYPLRARFNLVVPFVLNVAKHFLNASGDDVGSSDHLIGQ